MQNVRHHAIKNIKKRIKMSEDKKGMDLGGKIFLSVLGIFIVGIFAVAIIDELLGPNGPLFALIIIFVVIVFGVYIGKNQ